MALLRQTNQESPVSFFGSESKGSRLNGNPAQQALLARAILQPNFSYLDRERAAVQFSQILDRRDPKQKSLRVDRQTSLKVRQIFESTSDASVDSVFWEITDASLTAIRTPYDNSVITNNPQIEIPRKGDRPEQRFLERVAGDGIVIRSGDQESRHFLTGFLNHSQWGNDTRDLKLEPLLVEAYEKYGAHLHQFAVDALIAISTRGGQPGSVKRKETEQMMDRFAKAMFGKRWEYYVQLEILLGQRKQDILRTALSFLP